MAVIGRDTHIERALCPDRSAAAAGARPPGGVGRLLPV